MQIVAMFTYRLSNSDARLHNALCYSLLKCQEALRFLDVLCQKILTNVIQSYFEWYIKDIGDSLEFYVVVKGRDESSIYRDDCFSNFGMFSHLLAFKPKLYRYAIGPNGDRFACTREITLKDVCVSPVATNKFFFFFFSDQYSLHTRRYKFK